MNQFARESYLFKWPWKGTQHEVTNHEKYGYTFLSAFEEVFSIQL